MLRYVFCACVVFASLILLASGETKTKQLTCYKCHSCPQDPPEDSNITITHQFTTETCAVNVTNCFKYFHTDKRIERGCSPTPHSKDCPDDQGNRFRLAWCYTCGYDKCNSGHRLAETSTLTFGVAAVISFVIGATCWKN